VSYDRNSRARHPCALPHLRASCSASFRRKVGIFRADRPGNAMMVLTHRLMGRLKGEPEVAIEISRSKGSSKKDQKCEPSVEQEGSQLVV